MNQIAKLPATPAQVIEMRQYATTCSEYGAFQIEKPRAGYDMRHRFGSRLETTEV
jgi:hypothetical protein